VCVCTGVSKCLREREREREKERERERERNMIPELAAFAAT